MGPGMTTSLAVLYQECTTQIFVYIVAAETQTETGELLQIQIYGVDSENDTQTPGLPDEIVCVHARSACLF